MPDPSDQSASSAIAQSSSGRRLFGNPESREIAVSAEAFIVLAASAGLFDESPVRHRSLRVDRRGQSLQSLVKRNYVVRHAAERDLDRLLELEQLCWRHTRTAREEIRARLQRYPQGQFVLERDGHVLGAIYSQRIADVDAIDSCTAANVHTLHDFSGSVVQLLAVNIDPRVQNVSYGDQLLEFMLQLCGLTAGVTRIVGVTLCKSYRAEDGASLEEYIRQRGSGQDPVLAFHEAHGAEIVKVVRGYRPEDSANLTNGVLVSYDVLNRTPRRRAHDSDVHVAHTGQPPIEPFLRSETATMLAIGERDVDLDRPLMEMGLDSADLLKLQRHCESAFGLQLPAGFFFEYSSLRKVIAHLTARLVPTPAPVEAQQPSAIEGIAAEVMEELADQSARPAAATDIAIVGMACRLPGGIDTPEQLWTALASDRCVIAPYPKERGAWPFDAEYRGIDHGGFVDYGDAFDSAFFRISPAEAQITDPQQRMLMESAWACLEDAGLLPGALAGSNTGVFVGASNCDYSRLAQEAGIEVEAHHGVGNSLSILANRISYFFDLSGPSQVIDTACSSSLVALHAAVRSLRAGECATAFVGGVNFICHPDLSIAFHKAGMLAPDGRCKVFDASADGYVRSEGAVVFLLEPLAAAVANGHQVHAVIRGTATNHGGLASGLTVPNPQKQKELLLAAWRDAGVTAQEISYIEAHGTGTSLGDPIEVQGMQAAYAELATAAPAAPCAIGSVKGNLGHLESAAGLTGLLKIVLALQHRQLPATVNFAELNPKIALQETLVIQDRLGEWVAPGLRVAAVSSFGSGGTNAHAVVQEYRRKISDRRGEAESLFVLSAATEERLRAYVVRVIDWLQRRDADASFADAIHTWQLGRAAMRQRLAIKVTDALDLRDKLQRWLAGETVAEAWSGSAEQIDSAPYRAWQTRSGRQLIEQALIEGELESVGPLWSAGLAVDWRNCRRDAQRRLISVPTYPFARERHWIDTATRPAATTTVLHPLLHTNASDLDQQSYTTTLSGKEFFLADHGVRADGRHVQSVLPGVAYLEMARAAIEHALPARPESTVVELLDTVWLRPLVVTGRTQLRIALTPNDRDEIEYEIRGGKGDQELAHCLGRATMRDEPAPARIDLEQLARQMTAEPIGSHDAYAKFARMGFAYGPSFQAITAMQRGQGELLARLRLPKMAEAAGDFFVHPSVMDGAVQAAVALAADLAGGWSGGDVEPRLPFALESLRLFAPCTHEMVAWVRRSPGSPPIDRGARLDVDLCDPDGNVHIQMRGFSLRVPVRTSAGAAALLTPVWRAERLEGVVAAEAAQHHVIVCELEGAGIETLPTLLPRAMCVQSRAGQAAGIAQRFSDHALACFERVQAILRDKPRGRVLVQIVVGDEGEQELLAGLSGLLETAALENPQFAGQLLLVPRSITADALAVRLIEESKAGAFDPIVRDQGEVRQVLRWQPVASPQERPAPAFKDGGVYLITGGLGALGLLFAREISEKTRDARVLLTGRAAPSPETEEAVGKLSGHASYLQCDLESLEGVSNVIAAVLREHGRLDGILHCAGMTTDNFILRKTGSELRQVLAPKVAGTVHLDEATRNVALDFLVLFSSVAGAMGNVGQADYAMANAFMDRFATYRNRLVSAGERHGRTRSINWPLWLAGGMGTSESVRESLRQITGLQPLATATGLEAFHRILASPHDQVLVVEGDAAQVRSTLLRGRVAPSQPRAEQVAPAIAIDRDTLAGKARGFLREELSGVLKMPADAIDPKAALQTYGIDSILAMRLTGQLEKTFGPLAKTLFFEYRTISELTDYFVGEHAARLHALFATAGAAMAASAERSAAAPAKAASIRRFTRPRNDASEQRREQERIAIIGLSGRYPEAVNIEAYWRNLRDGRDCIVEVPGNRWDWRNYYSSDRTTSGRHFSKWGGFIEGVDEFDPLFFNIPPREAKYIDPQERLFLQHVWMAIEDAGYTRASLQLPDARDLSGQAGVYVGVMYGEYQLLSAASNAEELRMGFTGYLASIANRVSYVLDVHGPSMTIDTMCSSSLTAIHLACQDLRQGRTSVAIAGGVNVTIHPNKYLALSAGQFISSDGHCQSFGEGGDGYIPGEGVGVVVLKRLSDAERDGDQIYGVIRGSALNHGGKTNGYTVPNPQAQASAIRRALRESQTDARHVSYIEAHGTGTKLGDPIEIAALSRAFRDQTDETEFCLIGSAKSNIGHCESAAGIAGLTKVLLQMKHRQIVPSLHSEQLNPHIDFEKSPFRVNQTLRAWDAPVVDGRSVPRIAGISSFGAGGSNAHMVIEEYVAAERPAQAEAEVLIVLSARTGEQLRQKAADLLAYLREEGSSVDLAAVSYTLQVGREAMDERLALVVNSAEELVQRLQAYVAGQSSIEDGYQGRVKRGSQALINDESLQAMVDWSIAERTFGKLAELWVQGLEIDWSKLYDGRRPHRISLPVYPFARERYWIDLSAQTAAVRHSLRQRNTADLSEPRYRSTFNRQVALLRRPDHVPLRNLPGDGVHAEPESVGIVEAVPTVAVHPPIAFVPRPEASPVPAARKKPSAISLATPGAPVAASSVVSRIAVTLSTATVGLSLDRIGIQRASSVCSSDDGGGVFSVEIAAGTGVLELIEALERVQRDSSLKVLLLNGIEHVGDRQIHRALLSFPFPTVAVLQRDAVGAGFMTALLCDFLVCDEEAHYGCTDLDHGIYPDAVERAVLVARLGDVLADDLLFGPGASSGRQLRARGWTSPFVPATQVESHARQLATALAANVPDALRLLTEHVRRPVVGALFGATEWTPAELPSENERASQPLLASTLIRIETPAERVLALTLPIADAPELVAELGRIFAQLEEEPYYKAVVLASDDPEFLFAVPDTVVLEAQRLLGESKIPVVAALTRNAKGSAWLVAQSCDACIYNVDGVYAASVRPVLSQATAALFAQRLGEAAATELLLTGAEYSGRSLQQRVGALTAVERDQVMTVAVGLATSWTRLHRTTLAAWKRESAIALRQRIEAMPVSPQTTAIEETFAAPTAPITIPLLSGVMTATVHPDGVVVVTMEDRDAKNMFSAALMSGVREVFAHIEQTPAYKVVVLTGYDSYFASGGTKESLTAIQQGTAKFTDFDIYRVALDCRLPVVAAMQGHGIGAGWVMGMTADVVVLSEESQFVSPYMSYGFTPGAGATSVLPQKLGSDLGRESLLTAQPYTGRELRERGVTVRVLPRAEVLVEAMALARRIAQAPRGQLIALKGQLIARGRQPLDEAYRLELAMHEKTFVGRSETLARIESKFRREQSQPATPPIPQQPAAVVNRGDGDGLRAVAATLKTLLANELQMQESDLDDDKQFVELGLDSISGVTWLRKINARFGTSIDATRIYSHPTLLELSRCVKDEAEKSGTLPKQAAPSAAVHVTAVSPLRALETRRLRRGRAVAPARSPASAQQSSAIAVIGMAGRFPQANDLDAFWQQLAQGRNCITEVSPDRWDVDTYYQPGAAVPGKTNSRWAGMIDGYDQFDPLFFNISPTEAEHMDPQQRLFLQACWHSIENAGYDPRRLSGSKCGVFAGCADGDYQQLSREHRLTAQGFTGSAMSILAARASYFLNLQGPCISIDTACSSSLVAIAQACDSLVAGNSDLALAGGVHVMVGPEMHIKTAQAGMLSAEGKCFTFDQRADGFVPGEGVGMVLLKRLADAERDGDMIQAVIQGWGVNQDGKTNGITAPNPESQTRLQQEVYDKYGIDPATIELVEAHGTGTKLGDPIEVEGLKGAFRKYTQESGYCALGSVKSNIGHCLAAAGIAGTLKLILALKHRQLPPTIHFEKLNEHIDLSSSPFYVNTELRTWTPRGTNGRRAATSSFGFSGTNAHLVIGEYLPPPSVPGPVSVVTEAGKLMIPLSARTPEQLRQKVADLLAFLRSATPSADLVEIAYTLQVGREAMETRLGILAGSVEELTDLLDAYIQRRPAPESLHERNRNGMKSLGIIGRDDEATEAVVATWIAGGKLAKLLELWVDGLELDWNRLYGVVKPRRIALPLYPFAKERHWIEPTADGQGGAARPAAAMLHPLLHSNTSDLNGQRYSTTFTGEEFFLTDHRVTMHGSGVQKVLPGAAYLEMARAAIALSLPDRPETTVLELHDTLWLSPFVFTDRGGLSIAISADRDGRIDYEVYSAEGERQMVHCQGRALFGRDAAPAQLDLDALERQMGRGTLSASDLYALCSRMGLQYGLAHQGITAMHLGDGQLLAHLRLPDVLARDERDYVLHPSLIDGALQASIGLIVDGDRLPDGPPLPFVVELLRVLSPCTDEMTAWVRLDANSASARSAKVDIDLCDRSGKVCVQVRGFASRVLASVVEAGARPTVPLLHIKADVAETQSLSFDRAFYEQLIADVVSSRITVDEATDLG
jgi:acyl transferase domain-containing protein/enoyl-CoA hydratase/carnithine racemase/aryl carrier-like protein